MKINILYFGMIAEWKGETQELCEVSEGTKLFEMKQKAMNEIPDLQSINYSMAINQHMVTEDKELFEGDELAFFPPFAGG